jgi:hypothetical protein
MPDAFGRVDQIIYPLPDVLPIIVPIEVDSAPTTSENDL